MALTSFISYITFNYPTVKSMTDTMSSNIESKKFSSDSIQTVLYYSRRIDFPHIFTCAA